VRGCCLPQDGKGVCEEVFTSQGCERACPEGKVCSVKVRRALPRH
jgi:hypothetical protein